MRLIDADILTTHLIEVMKTASYAGNNARVSAISGCIGIIKGEKTIKKSRGTWIFKKFDEETGISNSYFCSCCNFPLTGIYDNYCAVCGADMRKER